MNTNTKLAQLIILEIENKLQWINSNEWQHKHFELLSDKIFEKTKVSLSPLTLKRLWGKVAYNSAPSATTLDVLAKFLDYESWIEFQNKNWSNKPKLSAYSISKFKRSFIFAGSTIVAITILLVMLQMKHPEKIKQYSDISFSAEPVTNNLPNTVYFHYNVKNTDADSIIIQQSWDPKLHHVVEKEKSYFSCIYYLPGYYKAKLVIDDSVVAQQDLFIKSNGWCGIIHKDAVPVYLHTDSLYANETFEITEDDLTNAGFDLKKSIPNSSLYLVEDLNNIEGNNFSVHAEFKQTYPKGDAICQNTGFVIMCENDYFYIPFSAKGCVSDLNMHIPGRTIIGKENDLKFLGIDHTDTIQINLNIINNFFTLHLKNNLVFSDSLRSDPGKIVGVQFGFHGTGILKEFEITADSTKYSIEDFITKNSALAIQ